MGLACLLCLASRAGAQTVVPSDPQPPTPVPGASATPPGVDCKAQPFLCDGSPDSSPQPNSPPAPVPGTSATPPGVDCKAQPFLCDGSPDSSPQPNSPPAPDPTQPPECQPKKNDPTTPLLPECNKVDGQPQPEECANLPDVPLAPGLFPECATPSGTAVPAPPPRECQSTGSDGATAGLGACSPMCRDVNSFDSTTRKACRLSGSIARPYPLTNYGLDVNAEFTLTKPLNLVLGALQELGALLWQIVIHLLDAVLLLLEWAFSLDLLGDADVMQRLHDGLTTFHERVLGEPWTLAALSIAALWGLWYGLVRGKTIETIAGLGGTLALMIVALLVIYRPDATIAPLSNFANQGSMQVIAGISQGTINDPKQSFASAQQGLTDALILRPWCALQFGDVDYCLNQRRDSDSAPVRARRAGEASIADAWLQSAPNASVRQALYKKTAGEETDVRISVDDCSKALMPQLGDGALIQTQAAKDQHAIMDEIQREMEANGGRIPTANGLRTPTAGDWKSWEKDWERFAISACEKLKNGTADVQKTMAFVWKDPSKVYLQEGSGTFERLALLAIILVGLLGAILLFGWLGVRLLLAAVFSLMYILMAPVLLLVAACGNAGRASVVAAGKRGFGQIVAKFVYAVLLALIVLEANILSSLELGFYATWLLQIAFWWGFFLKRHDFLGFLTLDQRVPGGLGLGADGTGSRSGFSFMNLWYGARTAKGAVRAVTAGPRAGIRRLRRAHLDHVEADSAAVREQARSELGLRARREAALGHEDRTADARGLLAEDGARKRRLARTEADIASGRFARGRTPHDPASMYRGAMARKERDQLKKRIAADAGRVKAAQAQIDAAGKPRELGDRDVDQWIERRRRDIQMRPADADQNLRAAGILPSDYARGSKEDREIMRNSSALIMARDRELLDRMGDPRNPGPRQAPLSADQRHEAFRESVGQGTLGDLSERARAIRRENKARDRFDRARAKTARGRRHVR
jgi:hypothetical protein